jgi:hypothetical protein
MEEISREKLFELMPYLKWKQKTMTSLISLYNKYSDVRWIYYFNNENHFDSPFPRSPRGIEVTSFIVSSKGDLIFVKYFPFYTTRKKIFIEQRKNNFEGVKLDLSDSDMLLKSPRLNKTDIYNFVNNRLAEKYEKVQMKMNDTF